MNNFRTLPLRFRVWDSKNNEMYSGCNIEEAAKLLRYIGKKNAIISQDTGLKDKNGRSIYSGDIIVDHSYIIECMYKLTGVVTESELVAGYTVTPSVNGRELSSNIVLSKINNYGVIGNIWQNPELLEEE